MMKATLHDTGVGVVTFLPSTRAGRLATWLLVASAGAFAAVAGLLAAGHHSGGRLLANPLLAASSLEATFTGIAAGIAATVAIVSRRDRSVVVFGAFTQGVLALHFAAYRLGALS